MEGLGFYGGIYLGFMGGIVFSAMVFIVCVAATQSLRKKEEALGLTNSATKFKCQSLGASVSEGTCRLHREMTPEACINCLIPVGEKS